MTAVRTIAVACGADDDMRPWLCAVRDRGVRMLVLPRVYPAARREELEQAAQISDRADARAAPPAAGDGEGCVLLATSGSSGTPRLVELSWRALEASARRGAERIPFGAGDAWHGSLSPAHVGGLMIHARALVLGGEVRVAKPPRIWRDLDGCTHCSLVAPQLARLLEDPDDPPASLRAVMLGGGPSPQALHDAAIARGVPLHSTYGMTETASQVATGRRAQGDLATLAGLPLRGVSIAIDAATREILVDGPMLARAIIRDGDRAPLARPHATRDAGFLDAAGRLHVVGRLDAMFISGGKNIHPEEIERALGSLACVRSACVVAVPHDKWGMRPVAFVDLASP
ncbi:MAG: AMP-binding protein, partial [Phycisphaerales bacterium]